MAFQYLMPVLLLAGLGAERSITSFAQTIPVVQAGDATPSALLEVRQLLPSTASVRDELLQLRLRCRIWDLLWPYQSIEAKSAMRALEDQVASSSFPKELKALSRSELLAVLFRRDPEEAWRLNGKAAEELKKSGASLNALANELMESSPEAAAEILKESIPADPSREALSSLWKLRDVSPALAEQVSEGALRAIDAAAGAKGIRLANSLAYYLFPEGTTSGSRQMSNLFFSSALQLIQTVSEAPPVLMSEAIQRQMLLNTLESIAPAFAPERIPELQGLSARLSGITRQASSAPDTNNTAAAGIVKGLLEHDDERAMNDAVRLEDSSLRDKLMDQLRLKKIQDALAKRDFELAFEYAEALTNQANKLESLGRIARASEQNPGWVTNACIDAIRQTILTSEPELIPMLRTVAVIYAIDPDAAAELHAVATARLNSGMKIEDLRGKELEMAIRGLFAAATTHSQSALNAATAINDPYLSLTARLAILEAKLK